MSPTRPSTTNHRPRMYTAVVEAITAIRDEFEVYGRRRVRAECAIEE